MSILSSTCTGYVQVHFKELYARRDQFVAEIENMWRPILENISTYNKEEFKFILDYLQLNECNDELFVTYIKELEENTVEFGQYGEFSEDTVYESDETEYKPMTHYEQKQYRKHGGRRPAKFF